MDVVQAYSAATAAVLGLSSYFCSAVVAVVTHGIEIETVIVVVREALATVVAAVTNHLRLARREFTGCKLPSFFPTHISPPSHID